MMEPTDENRTERLSVSLRPSERTQLKKLARAVDVSEAEMLHRLMLMGLDQSREVMDNPVLLRVLEVGFRVMDALGDQSSREAGKALRRLRSGDQLEFGDIEEGGSSEPATA